jgi:hypothetical protein
MYLKNRQTLTAMQHFYVANAQLFSSESRL